MFDATYSRHNAYQISSLLILHLHTCTKPCRYILKELQPAIGVYTFTFYPSTQYLFKFTKIFLRSRYLFIFSFPYFCRLVNYFLSVPKYICVCIYLYYYLFFQTFFYIFHLLILLIFLSGFFNVPIFSSFCFKFFFWVGGGRWKLNSSFYAFLYIDSFSIFFHSVFNFFFLAFFYF